MPTYTEKMLYGLGDAVGLKSVELDWGRLGGLICWEHWMPLTRQALHNSGELIHIALWPWVHEMHQIASRQYAFEGRCFVVAAGQRMTARELPAELEKPKDLAEDELLLKGGSAVIGPVGQYLLEPQWEGDFHLLTIEDLEQAIEERMTLDVAGHYQRLDVFDFEVKRTRN